MKKVVTMILILIISITFITNISNAAEIIDINSVEEPTPMDAPEITDRAGIILGVVRAVGVVVAVIALMYIGLKTLTGSLEEKSQYKQGLPGYLVGAIMVFSITFLPSLIYDITKGTFNNKETAEVEVSKRDAFEVKKSSVEELTQKIKNKESVSINELENVYKKYIQSDIKYTIDEESTSAINAVDYWDGYETIFNALYKKGWINNDTGELLSGFPLVESVAKKISEGYKYSTEELKYVYKRNIESVVNDYILNDEASDADHAINYCGNSAKSIYNVLKKNQLIDTETGKLK